MHTDQIHTSLSDKMFTDNFSRDEELIDMLFPLRKTSSIRVKKGNRVRKTSGDSETFARK